MTDGSGRPDPVTKHLAEGEAAFVLVESLLLTLVERRILTPEQVSEMIETAVEVKRRMASGGTDKGLSQTAAALLAKVENSLDAARPAGDVENGLG